ncbi:hypothetical protein FPZ12_024170 [Amycolatopsis acidicola]|uniref:Uncharacterized protein n=1 Tax=Amycolatopsis acidicola TaxID=2596893 RepID=A0A5N0UWT5_9PSEU|nr:hypothetical protein [Amycolatopsis acidicola]KAA9157743.1 hypothetical protein FPZ12_024170 [Amycolatopsis acidicola]
MSTTRPVTLAATLATTVRALRGINPAASPSLGKLRDSGWQLVQLTGGLTDLVTMLAEHTGHHLRHPSQVHRTDGTPDTAALARGCRDHRALRASR